MLNFQRNRTKPETIRILFVTSLDLVDSTKEEEPTLQSKKKSRIIALWLKNEWEYRFRTFLNYPYHHVSSNFICG